MSATGFNIFRASLSQKRGNRGPQKARHILIVSGPERALRVVRWGVVGRWGSMKVEQHNGALDTRDFNRLIDEAKGSGYEITGNSTHTQIGLGDVKTILAHTYWFKLGPDNLKFLDPSIDTTNVREVEFPAEYEKDDAGHFRRKEVKPRMIEIPEPTIEDNIAQNEMWGMF